MGSDEKIFPLQDKRQTRDDLFYEMLDEFIMKKLLSYGPIKPVFPIETRDDLEVDYLFQPNGNALYLFGIDDSTKARNTTICCLEFQKANLSFESIAVHEDFEKLSRKDHARITSASDKQFTSLDDIKQNAVKYFQRASGS